MKALKILLGIVILGIALLLGIGLAVPEFDYENEVVIDKPVATVWSVFTDESKMKDWLEGLQRVENLGGKPLEVGSKWRLEFDADGTKVVVDETVTAVEPNRRYAFDASTDLFTGPTEITFHEEGGRTRVRATSRVVGANLLMRSFLILAKSSMVAQSQKSYDALKRVCEAMP